MRRFPRPGRLVIALVILTAALVGGAVSGWTEHVPTPHYVVER